LVGALALFSAAVPPESSAQEVASGIREAYFRAVSEHFQVPLEEVRILADWGLTSDEVPVALFLARRGGVSTDALIGLRRGGRSWPEVAARVGLGARAFHISLPEGESLGLLTRVYGEFRSRAVVEWDQIRLEDPEVIALVNLRVLSEQAEVPALRVLRSREEAGSFTAAYPLLRRR
jgi:hypothetical protein